MRNLYNLGQAEDPGRARVPQLIQADGAEGPYKGDNGLQGGGGADDEGGAEGLSGLTPRIQYKQTPPSIPAPPPCLTSLSSRLLRRKTVLSSWLSQLLMMSGWMPVPSWRPPVEWGGGEGDYGGGRGQGRVIMGGGAGGREGGAGREGWMPVPSSLPLEVWGGGRSGCGGDGAGPPPSHRFMLYPLPTSHVFSGYLPPPSHTPAPPMCAFFMLASLMPIASMLLAPLPDTPPPLPPPPPCCCDCRCSRSDSRIRRRAFSMTAFMPPPRSGGEKSTASVGMPLAICCSSSQREMQRKMSTHLRG